MNCMENNTDTYFSVVSAIEAKRRFGRMYGRDVTSRFLDAVNHPEKGMKIIHIAGTNGKGSTAAGLERLLREDGFSTGLFTSPHLVDFAERIKYNGADIKREDVVRIGSMILSRTVTIDGKSYYLPDDIEDTMFDDSLLMALIFFKEKKCDYVILETGLGGLHDSTSGLSETPVLSIITRIGLDHCAILGNTIEEIAHEKAGILKRDTVLILSENDERARAVIRKVAGSLSLETVDMNEGSSFSAAAGEIVKKYPSSLKGTYQKENLTTAAAAFLRLKYGPDFQGFNELSKEDREKIKKAFISISWPGRMQILSEDPVIIADGAHNPQGVKALHDSLIKLFGDEKYIFATAVLRDKDMKDMVEIMAPLCGTVYISPVENQRALSPDLLSNEYSVYIDKKDIHICKSTEETIRLSSADGKRTGRKVIAFGSLYFIGDLLYELKKYISCNSKNI